MSFCEVTKFLSSLMIPLNAFSCAFPTPAKVSSIIVAKLSRELTTWAVSAASCLLLYFLSFSCLFALSFAAFGSMGSFALAASLAAFVAVLIATLLAAISSGVLGVFDFPDFPDVPLVLFLFKRLDSSMALASSFITSIALVFAFISSVNGLKASSSIFLSSDMSGGVVRRSSFFSALMLIRRAFSSPMVKLRFCMSTVSAI